MADNATQNLSTSDGADLMSQLPGEVLAFDETPEAAPEPTPEPQPQDDSAPDEDAEKPADPDDSETDDEQEDGDDEETEDPESETDDKAEAAEADEADPVFEVETSEGETQEVRLSEMAEAYTRVSQVETQRAELSERQKALEAREAEIPQRVNDAVRFEQDRLAQAIHHWSNEQQWVEAPNVSMLDENSPDYNPDQYHYQHARFQEQQGKAAQAAQALKGIAEQRQREQEAIFQTEFSTLEEKVPALKDEAEVQAVISFMSDKYGLSQDEMRGLVNHKVWHAFYDAMKGSKIKTELPKVREKVKARPPRPVKATARTAQETGKSADVKKKFKQLQKSGRWQDAASIFEDVL